MDEPFGSLDAQTKIVLQDELLKLFEQTRKTVLFVTHSIDEAILLGDEVMVMTARPGRVKEIVPVPLPRPRTLEILHSAEFGRIYDHIFGLIREEVMKSMWEEPRA
jgi:NitT/TauT family transport system ATP-binding protein